jgi:hypothetical protein
MQITIEVEGFDKLIAKLGSALAIETLRAPMGRAQSLIRERMQTYPPPTGGSYVRTYRLRDSWIVADVAESPSGMSGSIESDSVDYAPYVQHDPSLGDPHQSGMHVGRWQTDLQVVESSADEIGELFSAAIQAALS